MSKQAKQMRVVEVLGLPGAGKTTLINQIQKNYPCAQLIRAHSLMSVHSIFGYLFTLPRLMHLLLIIWSKKLGGGFKLADILALSQLLWWKHHLTAQSRSTQLITIIDEGPVGILSWSIEFGSENYKVFQSSPFFNQYIDFLAYSLNNIVILNIDPDLALDRIRQREPKHWLSKMKEEAALNVLSRIQTGQSSAASLLKSRNKGQYIIQVDVVDKSTTDLIQEIFHFINIWPDTLPTTIIHWPRLGPYHIARLEATAGLLKSRGYQLACLEIFTGEDEYLWQRVDRAHGFTRYTLFSGRTPGEIRLPALFKKIWDCLDDINPCAVAINGYSSWDSLCILSWCRIHQRHAILMSESKRDDAPRGIVKELLKMLIVSQFGAALCGGKLHREYLLQLKMPSDRIFDGYDAVDNQYFMTHSDKVRQSPEDYPLLPGLEVHHPFFLASGRFIPRKNFRGLVCAYSMYKEKCLKTNQIPWRLVILGNGPQHEELYQNIEQNNLHQDVSLAGARTYNELPVYYALAQAFIHPPLQDQWGLVVNEAMASGLPVIVSDRAGCVTDLVQPEKEGYIFNPHETAELAGLMYTYSFDTLDRKAMGNAAQVKIAAWGTDRFAHSFLKAVTLGGKQ